MELKLSEILCPVCRLALPQVSIDLGHGVHITCMKDVAGESLSASDGGTIETARKTHGTSPGPDRPSQASERNG